MTTISATSARTTLYRLIENLQSGQAPVLITGKKGNAVLVSEDDWRSIEATLHLMSIPGMTKSIRESEKEPLSSCSETIDL
jgi:PHD/YefM family antitoxin component YafN of YafNO toxin-antitoxin module